MSSSRDIIDNLQHGRIIPSPLNSTNPIRVDLADSYNELKDYYLLNSEEIDLIEEVTGLDATVLRLKRSGRVKEFKKSKTDYTELLTQQIAAAKTYQTTYAKFPFIIRWIARSPKSDDAILQMEADLNYLRNDLDPERNSTTRMYDAYIARIDGKISDIKEKNKSRLIKKRFDHLEKAKQVISYYKDSRQDLVHPGSRLLGESRRASVVDIGKRFLTNIKKLWRGLWGKNKKLHALAKAHIKKTNEKEKKLSANIAKEVNTIASQVEQQLPPIVAIYTKNEGLYSGIIQMRDISKVQNNSLTQLTYAPFPQSFLQEAVNKTNILIDLYEKILQTIKILEKIEKGMKEKTLDDHAVSRELSKIPGILNENNIHEIFLDNNYINGISKSLEAALAFAKNNFSRKASSTNKANELKEDIANSKSTTHTSDDSEESSIERSMSSSSSSSSSAPLIDRSVINTNLIEAFHLQMNSVRDNLGKLCLNEAINDEEFLKYEEHISWLNNTVAEMYKQHLALDKLTPSRCAKNMALLEPTAEYKRDDLANDLCNMTVQYHRELVEQNNSEFYTSKTSISKDAAEREAVMLNLQKIIECERIAHATNLTSFVGMGKDFVENKSKNGLEALASTEKYINTSYNSFLLPSAISLRDHIDVLKHNLHHHCREYKLARQTANEQQKDSLDNNFKNLLKNLKITIPENNDLLEESCINHIKKLKAERDSINDKVFVQAREAKQATKFVTGQLSYKLELRR